MNLQHATCVKIIIILKKKAAMFLSHSWNEGCQQSWASPASRTPASHRSAPAVTPLQLLQQTLFLLNKRD